MGLDSMSHAPSEACRRKPRAATRPTTMQLFAQLPDDRVVVLEASASDTAGEVVRRLHTSEPSARGACRLVKGGRTLPDDSTLGQCDVAAGDTVWLQTRLRGGSSEKDEGGKGSEEDDDVPALVHMWNLLTGKTQGSSGPLVPMTLYIVFLQSGFLFSQISTTFMVISQWGVEYAHAPTVYAHALSLSCMRD
eukprot:COSAG02_NODE_1508_length_12230_cov_7.647597_2_plen_192_part_00